MHHLINIAKETTFEVRATYCTFEVTSKSNDKVEKIDVTGIMISPHWIEVKPTYFRSQILNKKDLKPKKIKKLYKDLLSGTYYLNIRDYSNQELNIAADFLTTEWTKIIWTTLTAKDNEMTITLKDEVILERILKENQNLFRSKLDFDKFCAEKGLKTNDFIVPGKFSNLQIKLQEISIRLKMEQFFARRYLFTETLIKKINKRLDTYFKNNEIEFEKLSELQNWITDLKENNEIFEKYNNYQKLYEMPNQNINIKKSKNVTIIGGDVTKNKTKNISSSLKSKKSKIVLIATILGIIVAIMEIIIYWNEINEFLFNN